jgi:hypothetical protein
VWLWFVGTNLWLWVWILNSHKPSFSHVKCLPYPSEARLTLNEGYPSECFYFYCDVSNSSSTSSQQGSIAG